MDQFSLGANECLGITKTNQKLKILGDYNEIEVAGGEIIKILRLASLGACFVKLYTTNQRKTLILSDVTYSCDQANIKIINEKLGSMLITIGDRVKRLMICNSSENERFLINLKLNDLVKVNKFLLKRDHHAVCTVKYIGPVPEIGPGTYIGCTLYDEMDTIDEKHKLAIKYFNCKDGNGFIRNCGCFFTRTMLLEQNIDNLMKIVQATNRKNPCKLKIVDVIVPEPKIDTTPRATIPRSLPNNPIRQETAVKPTKGYLEARTTQPDLRQTNYTPKAQLSFNQLPALGPTTAATEVKSSVKPSSSNQIPHQTLFRSAYVYPETRTSVHSTNYGQHQFFDNQTSSTRHNRSEVKSSLYSAQLPYNANSIPNIKATEQPKKKGCSVM